MKINISKILYDVWTVLVIFVLGIILCFGVYFGLSLLTMKKSDIQENEEIILKLNAAYFNASQTNWNIIVVPRTNN